MGDSGEMTKDADGAGMFWPSSPAPDDLRSFVVNDAGNGIGWRAKELLNFSYRKMNL